MFKHVWQLWFVVVGAPRSHLKNENISAKMIEIMESLHKYVPSKTSRQGMIELLDSCLFGGDQLTCARARGAKRHWQDSETAVEWLSGLEPVVEDWHTKMCLYEVRRKASRCTVRSFMR